MKKIFKSIGLAILTMIIIIIVVAIFIYMLLNHPFISTIIVMIFITGMIAKSFYEDF